MISDMGEALAKIRPHISSSLPHQKAPANLLIALETTFEEQGTDRSPTAYFAILLTALENTVQKGDLSLEDGAILPAEIYLMALVAPFVPIPVVRSNLNTLLSLTGPLFPALNRYAPALRSQLTLYHTIFQSLDRSSLEMQGIRQGFASIQEMCVDRRPKVRKKAVEVLTYVLANPPAPLLRHPYAERVAAWVLSSLAEAAAGPLSRGKVKEGANPGAEIAIHALAFLKSTISALPPSSLLPLTNLILSLPRLGNTYLSQSCYSVLSDIFSASIDDVSSDLGKQLPGLLKVILSSPASKSDFPLAASWVRVMGHALITLHSINPKAASTEFYKVWKGVWNFVDSPDQATRNATACALSEISSCFSSLISNSGTEVSPVIPKILDQVAKALDSLGYARSIPELLSITSSVITSLRCCQATPTITEHLTTPLLLTIGKLRVSKTFEYKEAADASLGTAMRALGPHVLLEVLPLNLEPELRASGAEPRAFLLPLLAQPHPSPLSHFIVYFVPLSEKMFDIQQKAETEGRQAEAKVWSVLIGQIWAGLAGYCLGTQDLNTSLNPEFSQLLSQLLYSQLELRPAILKALKVLVDSNLSYSTDDPTRGDGWVGLSRGDALGNLAFLRTQVESWLAVLFNVYSTTGRDSRGLVGEVISSWINIAGEKEVHNAFIKATDIFKSGLLTSHRTFAQGGSNGEDGNMTTISLDILITLLPRLSSADSLSTFDLCLTADVLGGKNNAVQKRAYKILTKVVEENKIAIDAEVVLGKLDDLMENLTPAAKKDRFNLLTLLTNLLPSTSMHVIPSLIPEAILGTKEPSEKARTAAFELVVAMGRKMSGGGVVKRHMVDGMDEDVSADTIASIEEFMTMVAGGLAGASPHMISATVTAISRLVFEFKDTISPNMHTEILTTLLVFLSSVNREIVKSILGFVKLAIHTLPTDLIKPHLQELVPALLNWSHDHKNHFKVKVRHIFERLLRRFSWEEIYSCAGESEAGKVLVNIKKHKERAKRKRAARDGAEGEDEEKEIPAKVAVGDAFEDVLYGSESEQDDSDDDMPTTNAGKKKVPFQNLRLRVDNDEPVDLLQGAATRITKLEADGRRKPGQDASRFKTEEGTGKMVIDDEGNSEPEMPDDDTLGVVGNAYRESITSVDGFTRGATGKIKFNKDTKKRRREEEDFSRDVEMADADEPAAGKTKKAKRKAEPKFGHEFKAKRAGGDVKKNGVDPYAYLSLSQAAKARGRNKIGIAGNSKR